MKKFNKLFALLLAAVMAITISAPAFAKEKPSKVDQLKADIKKIESVKLDNLHKFKTENEKWIKDVNTRLEEYLEDIPKDKRDNVLRELRGETTGVVGVTAVSDYFTSYSYHYRNGYMTYSMTPKTSTRVLRPYCQAGWVELGKAYTAIAQSAAGSSLHDQYWCHFEALIESDWDIEEGRPDVSFLKTIQKLCNPT